MNQPRSSQVAKPAPAPPPAIVAVNQLFDQHRRAIEDALPKHLTAQRMIRIALTELRKTPKLQQCDPLSFLGAIVQASQLGLEPGGALGLCYLIPYGREVQLQLGYRGMVDLARRSGNIISISARCVYAGDTFHAQLGTDESIVHTPTFGSTDILFVYAVAKLRDGGVQFEVMSKAEIEYIRDTYSSGYKQSPKSSPWSTAFDEMAKKTVVRRLFKMLPTSIEIRDAVRLDEDDDQRNAKLIDPNHEVMQLLPDPEKAARLSAEAANDVLQTSQAASADKALAMRDFEMAVAGIRKAGHDPEKLLKKSINDVLLGDAKGIQAAADYLSTVDLPS